MKVNLLMKKINSVVKELKEWIGGLFTKGGENMHNCNDIKQVDSIELSKYILSFFCRRGESINHLKLQKLVYYVDAWHNVFLDKPLIPEKFEAWMHGPVVRELWDYYKDESILSSPISTCNSNYDLQVSKEQLEIINDVLEEYGDKTPYYLECLTHEEKPWIVARMGYAPSDKCTEKISKEVMKEYYSAKLDNYA